MTQDISSMLAENEPCMCGNATLVTLVSSTCITVTIITENVMAHLWTDPTGASLIRFRAPGRRAELRGGPAASRAPPGLAPEATAERGQNEPPGHLESVAAQARLAA